MNYFEKISLHHFNLFEVLTALYDLYPGLKSNVENFLGTAKSTAQNPLSSTSTFCLLFAHLGDRGKKLNSVIITGDVEFFQD